MELATATWLADPEGLEHVAWASGQDLDVFGLARSLRKRLAAEQAAAVSLQVDLRRRARAKFPAADLMLFTPKGLEQATSWDVALYHARLFTPFCERADLCAGIGGDLMALGLDGHTVALEIDPVAAVFARHNAACDGERRDVEVEVGDAAAFAGPADAAFIDPDRRPDGERHGPAVMSPSLDELECVFTSTENVCVKCSPALDYGSLGRRMDRPFSVEIVALEGECKETLLRFGAFSEGAGMRRATLLPEGRTMAGDAEPELAVREPGKYLVEPAGAVARARLVGLLGSEIGAWRLDSGTTYLTADAPRFTPFADYYEIDEVVDLKDKRALKGLARRAGLRIHAVKGGGLPERADKIRKMFRPGTPRDPYLFLTRASGRAVAMIARRI